jgi:hypothetical protein
MSFLLLTFLLLGLFCFWAPTNDDHATSAFYLLTQQRKCHADSQIRKLQFLKSSKISKGFFLSFCHINAHAGFPSIQVSDIVCFNDSSYSPIILFCFESGYYFRIENRLTCRQGLKE